MMDDNVGKDDDTLRHIYNSDIPFFTCNDKILKQSADIISTCISKHIKLC
jgi:hypothetical protein